MGGQNVYSAMKSTLAWLERRVQDAEARNPKVRMLKDEIDRAGRESREASTVEGRRAALDAQETAIRELLEEALGPKS